MSVSEAVYGTAVAATAVALLWVPPRPLAATEPTLPPNLEPAEATRAAIELLRVYGYNLSPGRPPTPSRGPRLELHAFDEERKLGFLYLEEPTSDDTTLSRVRQAPAEGWAVLAIEPVPRRWELRNRLYEGLHELRPAECAATELLAPEIIPGYERLQAISVLEAADRPAPLLAWLERHDPRLAEGDEPPQYLGEYAITALGNMRAAKAEALLLDYFRATDVPSRWFRERVADSLARINGTRTRAELEGWLEIDWLSMKEPPTEGVRALSLLGRMGDERAQRLALSLLAGDPTHEQVEAALATLRYFSDDAIRDALLAFVGSHLQGSRRHATGPALEQLVYYEFQEPPAELVRIFDDTYRYGHWMDRRILTAVCLAKAGHSAAEPFLLKRLELHSHRLLIAYALHRLGDDRGLERIEQYLRMQRQVMPYQYTFDYDFSRYLALLRSAVSTGS